LNRALVVEWTEQVAMNAFGIPEVKEFVADGGGNLVMANLIPVEKRHVIDGGIAMLERAELRKKCGAHEAKDEEIFGVRQFAKETVVSQNNLVNKGYQAVGFWR
jgi:hypothetical protein